MKRKAATIEKELKKLDQQRGKLIAELAEAKRTTVLGEVNRDELEWDTWDLDEIFLQLFTNGAYDQHEHKMIVDLHQSEAAGLHWLMPDVMSRLLADESSDRIPRYGIAEVRTSDLFESIGEQLQGVVPADDLANTAEEKTAEVLKLFRQELHDKCVRGYWYDCEVSEVLIL